MTVSCQQHTARAQTKTSHVKLLTIVLLPNLTGYTVYTQHFRCMPISVGLIFKFPKTLTNFLILD